MNYLVETKTEYTTQLTNLLVPLIYDGVSSMYEDAVKVAKENEELKVFQGFLKKVPRWNSSLLDNEANRILTMSGCPDLVRDLINAVVKANIMVLTNTPPEERHKLKITTKIDFVTFIHRCYIETARVFYNNPYLFYHKHSLYDIKRNQREAHDNIKASIIEAIRKMLPLKLILQEYLGNSFKDNVDPDFDHTVSEVEKKNLNTMLSVEKKEEQAVASPAAPMAMPMAMPTAQTLSAPKQLEGGASGSVPAKSETAAKHHSSTPVKPAAQAAPHQPPNYNEADVESASYYRRPTIEDSFSNRASQVRQIFMDRFSESNPVELSNEEHKESIQERMRNREKKNVSNFYKL
jgi:hypothetical protein